MSLPLTTLGAAGGILVSLYCVRKWLNGGRCYSTGRLDKKTVLVTGANTGIGLETAVDLAKRGATVVMACRDAKRGECAVNEVKERSGSSTVFLKILDLASLASIREFSKSFVVEYEKLHILINNAGVMFCPYQKTEDGFEMQIGVNHFGVFALTNLLLEKMVESAPSRIVTVSSVAHAGVGVGVFRSKSGIYFDDINSENGYDATFAYCQSKLAGIIFTKELSRKLASTGVTAYSLHPGVVSTPLYRHVVGGNLFNSVVGRIVAKTPEQGAQTSIYCAVQEGIEEQSGMYFSDCAVTKSSKQSYDEGIAKKLWEMSEEMTGVRFSLANCRSK